MTTPSETPAAVKPLPEGPPPATAPAAQAPLPLLVDGCEAARLCSIGKSLFYSLLATERFGPKPVRLGRAVRFSRTEIEAWIAAGAPPRARWEAMRGGRR